MNERERLIELLKNVPRNTRVFYGQYADYLLKNGVIVPPCKVGQKVYLLRSPMNDVIEGEVTGLKTTEFSKYTVVFLIDDNRYTEIPFGAYGKTVFFTREEAEQALGKEDEGK